MKNAVIFGANGQDGFYLQAALQSLGYQTTGVSRTGNWTKGDVSDFDFVFTLIKETQPDLIFHLAANSSTHHEALFDNQKAITQGTINILESVKRLKPTSKVFLSGSGLQFVNRNIPINEEMPFEASSAYSLCRIQSYWTATYYRSLGLSIYFGYFFNHESPFRGEKHLTKKVVTIAQRIKAGDNVKLTIGDLTVKKEYTHAKDMMRAVCMFVSQDKYYDMILGSGQAYSIQEWVELVFGLLHLDWKAHVIQESNFKPQYRILVSDPTRLKEIGWRPAISLGDLAKEMIGL